MKKKEINKNDILLIITCIIFFLVGLYLTFKLPIHRLLKNLDSEAISYKMTYITNDDLYQPTYYFKVKNHEYTCTSATESSDIPNEKNIIYYNINNPNQCLTEYETNNKLIGILFLSIAILLFYFTYIKKPSTKTSNNYQTNLEYSKQEEFNNKIQEKMTSETISKFFNIITIIKYIPFFIALAVLLFFILINTGLVKQTIKSKNYETGYATFKESRNCDNKFDCTGIYILNINGKEYELEDYFYDQLDYEDEMFVKYNKNNPTDFYKRTSLMDTKQIIIYFIEVIIFIVVNIIVIRKIIKSFKDSKPEITNYQ